MFFQQTSWRRAYFTFFSSKFPKSLSYHLSLDFKPQGKTKAPDVKTVGEHILADAYRDRYEILGVQPVVA